MASCERSACLRRERLVGYATSVGRVVARALCQPTLWLGSSHSPSPPPPSCSSALPAAAGRICPTGCAGQLRSLAGLGGKLLFSSLHSSSLSSTKAQAKTRHHRDEFLFIVYFNSFGTPDRSRTYNLLLRTEPLYPVELPGHGYSIACPLLWCEQCHSTKKPRHGHLSGPNYSALLYYHKWL